MPTFSVSIVVTLPENFGDFQAVEKKILELVRAGGKELLGKTLKGYEEFALGKRVHQKKDELDKTYQTLLGEVKLKRWRVKDVFSKKYVKPLDDWLGLKSHQQVSEGLGKEIVKQCVKHPYGVATRAVNEFLGVKRSEVGNWKFVQSFSEREQKRVPKVRSWKNQSLTGLELDEQDHCPLLGIDPDETFVRGRRRSDKNHELKMAVIYSAKKPLSFKNKKRRQLFQKQVILGRVDRNATQLFDRVMDKAVKDYGAHRETQVLCHGDGASWIRQFRENYPLKILNRLDPYHAFKNIRSALSIEEIPKDWMKDFYTDPDRLISKIRSLEKEFADQEDQEKAKKLAQYFENNREGMLPSGASKEFKKKHRWMYLRGSGTIESNIFWSICRRFKAPRMMWSARGLNNLSFLRERELNDSLDFKRVKRLKIPTPQESQRAQELREVVKDFCAQGETDYWRLC